MTAHGTLLGGSYPEFLDLMAEPFAHQLGRIDSPLPSSQSGATGLRIIPSGYDTPNLRSRDRIPPYRHRSRFKANAQHLPEPHQILASSMVQAVASAIGCPPSLAPFKPLNRNAAAYGRLHLLNTIVPGMAPMAPRTKPQPKM